MAGICSGGSGSGCRTNKRDENTALGSLKDGLTTGTAAFIHLKYMDIYALVDG